MREEIVWQVIRVYLELLIGVYIENRSCLIEIIVCHVVATRSISVEMWGSWEIVLRIESYTVLIVDEFVVFDGKAIRIGEAELAIDSHFFR